ncbi:MAG: glycosyltransferase family 2 protein [Verrucomicrobiales bacterium]|nr:glycosyltransferase family 2 protein [Verrucomicrobiales bacterium]MCP5526043.1 glycosyltransferase family 2 protein [Verrucomicrobiales bacterium]
MSQAPASRTRAATEPSNAAPDGGRRASIVIPVHNEAEALPGLLAAFEHGGVLRDYEVLIVDDGSTDNSPELIAGHPAITLIRHPANRGYGAALKTGVRRASCDKVIFMDGDGQHAPDALDTVVRLLDDHALVIGERGADSPQQRRRLAGKRLVRVLGEYLLEQRLPDYNSGFRGFQRERLLPILGLLPNGFSFSTTSTLAFIKQGWEYATVPIHVRARVGRPSSMRFVRDGLKMALLVLRMVMLFNPLKIFCPASMLFGLIGLGWGVFGFFTADRIPNSAVLTIVLGMFLFFIGLLADQIALLHSSSNGSQGGRS